MMFKSGIKNIRLSSIEAMTILVLANIKRAKIKAINIAFRYIFCF